MTLVYCADCSSMRSERIPSCYCGCTSITWEPEAEVVPFPIDRDGQLHIPVPEKRTAREAAGRSSILSRIESYREVAA